MPDPALGIGDTAVNKTCLMVLKFYGERQISLPEGDERCRVKGSRGKSAGN